MMFNATFNNISVISWRAVWLVKETWIPGENYHYHIMLYQVHLDWAGFELTTLVVIGTDCIGSCISNLILIIHYIGTVNFKYIYICNKHCQYRSRSWTYKDPGTLHTRYALCSTVRLFGIIPDNPHREGTTYPPHGTCWVALLVL